MNAATGGIVISVNTRAYNAILSIDIISSRIMAIHFQGNPHITVYHATVRWRSREGCILPFPKKGNLSITKNYRAITLT